MCGTNASCGLGVREVRSKRKDEYWNFMDLENVYDMKESEESHSVRLRVLM